MPTIGVSIAVPPPHGEMLRAKRSSFGDAEAQRIPTHITLLPPTEVAAEEMATAVDHLAAVSRSGHPFPMVLRGTGTFRPVSPVVFVQVSQGIAECEVLERAIRRGPLKRRREYYFHPHVTVAHRVPETCLERAMKELADFEASFEVAEFHLYEHGADQVWRPVRAFELDGATG